MKMWMVAVCVALGLAACGTSGGGLRNDAYKQITEKKEEVVAHFNVDGSTAASKVANGFYRKLLMLAAETDCPSAVQPSAFTKPPSTYSKLPANLPSGW